MSNEIKNKILQFCPIGHQLWYDVLGEHNEKVWVCIDGIYMTFSKKGGIYREKPRIETRTVVINFYPEGLSCIHTNMEKAIRNKKEDILATKSFDLTFEHGEGL